MMKVNEIKFARSRVLHAQFTSIKVGKKSGMHSISLYTRSLAYKAKLVIAFINDVIPPFSFFNRA